MSDAPGLALPQPVAHHHDVLGDITQFFNKTMDIEIREQAPTIYADGVVVHWLPSVVVQEEAHPLTQEVNLRPGLMLSIWIGPNEEGQAIGVNPIMDQVFALSDRGEVLKFLRFCLAAIEASYVSSGVKF